NLSTGTYPRRRRIESWRHVHPTSRTIACSIRSGLTFRTIRCFPSQSIHLRLSCTGMAVRILAIGDIVGRPGRQVVHDKLPALVREHQVDLVIANAENIAGGSGITPNLFHKIRSYGVDVVTLGDHVYKRLDIVPTLQASERIIRPANLAGAAAGRTFTIVQTNSGFSVAIFTLLGRIFMNQLPADDPFATADRLLK